MANRLPYTSVDSSEQACKVAFINQCLISTPRREDGLPKIKQELVAVHMHETARSNARFQTKPLPFRAPTPIPNRDRQRAATIAWIWTKATLPMIIFAISRRHVMLPKFAWVHKRDAKHISRLPFRPCNAVVRINNCGTSTKAGEFCKYAKNWGIKCRKYISNRWRKYKRTYIWIEIKDVI